jgi:hypothetical protein
VSRKSLFALGAAALTIGSMTLVAAPSHAQSHYGHHHYRACVTADHGAWLFAQRCHRHGYGYGDGDGYGHRRHCWRPVHSGRAFRVVRQSGGYLLVRNLQARGWIELNSLRVAPQEYCQAAGI